MGFRFRFGVRFALGSGLILGFGVGLGFGALTGFASDVVGPDAIGHVHPHDWPRLAVDIAFAFEPVLVGAIELQLVALQIRCAPILRAKKTKQENNKFKKKN